MSHQNSHTMNATGVRLNVGGSGASRRSTVRWHRQLDDVVVTDAYGNSVWLVTATIHRARMGDRHHLRRDGYRATIHTGGIRSSTNRPRARTAGRERERPAMGGFTLPMVPSRPAPATSVSGGRLDLMASRPTWGYRFCCVMQAPATSYTLI